MVLFFCCRRQIRTYPVLRSRRTALSQTFSEILPTPAQDGPCWPKCMSCNSQQHSETACSLALRGCNTQFRRTIRQDLYDSCTFNDVAPFPFSSVQWRGEISARQSGRLQLGFPRSSTLNLQVSSRLGVCRRFAPGLQGI